MTNLIIKIYLNPTVKKNKNYIILNDEVYNISSKKRNINMKFNLYITVSVDGLYKFILSQNVFNSDISKSYRLKINKRKLTMFEEIYLPKMDNYLKRWFR